MKPIPEDIREAFKAFQSQQSKYNVWEGNYDKSHSDKCRETRLWNKLVKLMVDHGYTTRSQQMNLSAKLCADLEKEL